MVGLVQIYAALLDDLFQPDSLTRPKKDLPMWEIQPGRKKSTDTDADVGRLFSRILDDFPIVYLQANESPDKGLPPGNWKGVRAYTWIIPPGTDSEELFDKLIETGNWSIFASDHEAEFEFKSTDFDYSLDQVMEHSVSLLLMQKFKQSEYVILVNPDFDAPVPSSRSLPEPLAVNYTRLGSFIADFFTRIEEKGFEDEREVARWFASARVGSGNAQIIEEGRRFFREPDESWRSMGDVAGRGDLSIGQNREWLSGIIDELAKYEEYAVTEALLSGVVEDAIGIAANYLEKERWSVSREVRIIRSFAEPYISTAEITLNRISGGKPDTDSAEHIHILLYELGKPRDGEEVGRSATTRLNDFPSVNRIKGRQGMICIIGFVIMFVVFVTVVISFIIYTEG